MAGVHEVDDLCVGFVGVLSVQTAGVLLQGAFPRNWHGQHQRIQRSVIEALANKHFR